MWSKHHNLINNPTSLGVKAKLPKVMAREGRSKVGENDTMVKEVGNNGTCPSYKAS
jgi:hypothetical protein